MNILYWIKLLAGLSFGFASIFSYCVVVWCICDYMYQEIKRLRGIKKTPPPEGAGALVFVSMIIAVLTYCMARRLLLP